MDFLLTHASSIDFNTNQLVLDDGTVLNLMETDPDFLSNPDFEVINSITDVSHIKGRVSLPSVMPTDMTKRQKRKLINHVRRQPLTHDDFERLYEKYPQVLNEGNFRAKPKHKTEHHIKTNGPPVKCKARRLDAKGIAILREVIDDLIKKGIARRSKSNYASPMVMVTNDEKSRLCGDYSEVNKQTVPDAYCVRHIQDVNLELYGCKYFSKVDMMKAFNQIPVAKADIHKTAVATPIGLFEWVRMPFGLMNAAATFQRFVDEILEGIDGVFPYQDDVLAYSKTIEEHYEILEKIFQRFAENGIVINRGKSELCKSKIAILGFEVSEEGIKPDPAKLETVENMGKPTTEAQLHTFIGIINYYNRFIPGCSLILAPLYKLFTKKKKCRKVVVWNEEADRAFRLAKESLNEICLTHPDYTKEIAVMIDASDFGIGGVIQQLEGDVWRPIQYFSRKLSDTEKRYSTFGRELLAAFASVKKFRHHLESQDFTLFTDHQALVAAINKPHLNHQRIDREARQLDYLCTFVREGRAKHIPGKENIVADVLSRTVNSIIFPAEVELIEIQREQQKEGFPEEDKEFYATRTLNLPNGKLKVIYNTENGYDRLYIPRTMRWEVFDRYHDKVHRGVKASKRYMTDRYYWPGMATEITDWVLNCVPCGLAKAMNNTKPPWGEYEADLCRFHTVHIDIVTMDKEINGYKNVLTMIDRTTAWPEAIPIINCEAKTVAWVLVESWIKNWGVPRKIVSDQGKQFDGELFAELCRLLQTKKCRTTPYNPKCNAKIERFHRTLKEAIMAISPHDWFTSLPLTMLGLRNAYKEDLKASPAQLVLGTDLHAPYDIIARPEEPADLPLDFAEKLKQVLDMKSKPIKPHCTDNGKIPTKLMKANYVFMKKGQFARKGPKNSGPHKVVKRSLHTFDIVNDKGKTVTVSIDHLMPAPDQSDAPPATKSVQIAKKAKQRQPAATGNTASSSKRCEKGKATKKAPMRGSSAKPSNPPSKQNTQIKPTGESPREGLWRKADFMQADGQAQARQTRSGTRF